MEDKFRILRKLSEILSRSPGELKRLQDRKTQQSKILIFSALLTVTFGLIAVWLCMQTIKWKQLKVTLPLTTEKWNVLLQSDECNRSRHCLANPGSALWESPLTRASSDYREKLRSQGTHAFWIGTIIPRQTLEEAQRRGANTLFLGRIYAKYSMWINGQRAKLADSINDDFVLPQIRDPEWTNSSGIFLAIRIENLNRYSYPELTIFELGEVGFITPEELAGLRSLVSFSDWGRPLAFAAINLLIALTFFLFWYVDTVKQEYLWFAGFSLIHGITQVLLVPAFIVALGQTDKVLKMGLESWEVTLPMTLGFVFVRADPKWIRGLGIISVTLSVIAASVGWYAGMDNSLHNRIHPLLGIICGGIGASVCLNEAYINEGTIHKRRIYRLTAFSATLCFIALLYWFFAYRLYSSDTVIVIWHRLAHLFATMVLGVVMFSDVREMAEKVREIPWSKFHKNEQLLGKPVLGTLFVFDLKKSEILTSYRESGLESRIIQREAMAPFRTAAIQAGIEFRDNAGDGISLFFPEIEFPPEQVYLRILPELWNAASRISESLKIRKISPPGWEANYRAMICFGGIIPAFVISEDGQKTATWENGENDPLLEIARLEEFERKQLDPNRSETNVLLSSSFVEKLKAKKIDCKELGIPIPVANKHHFDRCAYRIRYPQTEKKEAA